jgi:mRNA-degrading endonuclease RelE of RelBE toxin-antitoxin system
MGTSKAYEIQLTKGAARQLRELNPVESDRVRKSLKSLAARSGDSAGSRGGKSLKQIRGRRDRFYRLRVGELRVVFELVHEDAVVLVHGILNRRDLDRWLRGH